ncbi:M48 family metallopeptidase [Sphingomonas sp.]|uniref:M48 family metallopeptidase n=1 Tax=Sphingomonas sp. TaxID=28214 RepID=UPI0025F28EE1|nr:M48 family metallopeptidase [Sphingomonas sp.]
MSASIIALALAFAAPDPGVAALQAADARVAAIAWRLQTANAPLCSDVAPLAGFSVQTLAQYQPSVRATVVAQTGLGRQPAVQAVVSGGAGDLAGLRVGDVLIAIDGTATPADLPTRASYDVTAKTQAMIEAALKTPPLTLRLMRGKSVRTVGMTGVSGCVSRVEIVTGRIINAEADGHYVQVSGSLVDFTTNDDELATVIGHELSHNILHHRLRLDTDKVSRGIFAGFGKGGARLRKTEYEADRLGVWLVARAGYDVDAIVPFWSRLGRRTGLGILSDGTHPSWGDRIARVAAAVAEVKAQRAKGVALIPTELPIALPPA